MADKIYLSVPYEHKDAAKRGGARWDAAARSWYYPGSMLPAQLQQFAPAGGAVAESDLALQVGEIAARIWAEIPGAVAALRQVVAAKIASIDPLERLQRDPYASAEAVLALSDEDVAADARDLLARSLDTDTEALQRTIAGQHPATGSAAALQAAAAFRATFGGSPLCERDRLHAAKALTAAGLVRTAWQGRAAESARRNQIAAEHALRDRRKAIIDSIAADVDLHSLALAYIADQTYRGQYEIECHQVGDALHIYAINGDRVRDWQLVGEHFEGLRSLQARLTEAWQRAMAAAEKASKPRRRRPAHP